MGRQVTRQQQLEAVPMEPRGTAPATQLMAPLLWDCCTCTVWAGCAAIPMQLLCSTGCAPACVPTGCQHWCPPRDGEHWLSWHHTSQVTCPPAAGGIPELLLFRPFPSLPSIFRVGFSWVPKIPNTDFMETEGEAPQGRAGAIQRWWLLCGSRC